MALNIKNPETEALATEVARLAGESKTAAITTALRERRERLMLGGTGLKRGQLLQKMLADDVWPYAPPGVLGRPLTKEEEEEILGFGPDGV